MTDSPELPPALVNLGLMLGSGGIGAILLALIQKPWTKAERDRHEAASAKDKNEGNAGVLHAMASTFTDVTASLREEIERLQNDAGEMRLRTIKFELELKAALQQVSDLEKLLSHKDRTNEELMVELTKARAERDLAQSHVVQQEGVIRQLNAVIESQRRENERHDAA